MRDIDAQAVAAATAIPAHVVQEKGHGHAGTAMGLAPLAWVLWSRVLRHSPTQPAWLGRDRVVLSAGHASLLLYVQLVLSGYGLRLDELAQSRQLGSRTPGHPELGVTPGVEMSTGPLGQGVASAVGMALAGRHELALFNAPSGVLDHTVWCIAGDGCLQEGVSGEASSLAGTLGLGNLVVLWDDNRITIDGATSVTFTEDVRARYAAYGWRVLAVSVGASLDEIEQVLLDARASDGRPTLVAVRTVIGAPSVAVQGTPTAHAGGFGDEAVAQVKVTLGFAPDAPLEHLAPASLLEETRSRAATRGAALVRTWQDAVARWKADAPADHARWTAFRDGACTPLSIELPPTGAKLATRAANKAVLTELAAGDALFGGSADLSASTSVNVPGTAFSAAHPSGSVVHFGVREHAMAAILTGIVLAGPWRTYGSTYLAFSDYARPAIRLAALMGSPVTYVFTHDSLAVGPDGPTHQPVEQLAGLRTVPGLHVVRPGDAVETYGAWDRLLANQSHPTALVLSRQALPVLAEGQRRRVLVARGGYVVSTDGAEAPDVVLIGTGSELRLVLDAAADLRTAGLRVQVVSMPCVEWFLEQPADYRDSVIPAHAKRVVAVEAGRGDAWYRFADAVVSVERFGESGSGDEVLARAGITTDAVVAAALRLDATGAEPEK